MATLYSLIHASATGATLQALDLNLKEAFKLNLIKEIQALPFSFEFGRNTAWLGVPELNYPYANKDHLATGWTKYTQILTEAMNKKLGTSFNHLLVNQYMPNQKLAMHKDNEPELQGSILSLSLGDTATFKFSTGRGRTSFKSAIDLKDGDFIIGNRSFFNQFYHGVSVPHNAQVRYNLTWRTIERASS